VTKLVAFNMKKQVKTKTSHLASHSSTQEQSRSHVNTLGILEEKESFTLEQKHPQAPCGFRILEYKSD